MNIETIAAWIIVGSTAADIIYFLFIPRKKPHKSDQREIERIRKARSKM